MKIKSQYKTTRANILGFLLSVSICLLHVLSSYFKYLFSRYTLGNPSPHPKKSTCYCTVLKRRCILFSSSWSYFCLTHIKKKQKTEVVQVLKMIILTSIIIAYHSNLLSLDHVILIDSSCQWQWR